MICYDCNFLGAHGSLCDGFLPVQVLQYNQGKYVLYSFKDNGYCIELLKEFVKQFVQALLLLKHISATEFLLKDVPFWHSLLYGL